MTIVPLLVFFVAMALFAFTSRFHVPYTLHGMNGVFAADMREIAHAMTKPTFRGDMRKHPLFSYTVAPAVMSVKRVLNVSDDESILLVLPVISGINIAGAFILFKRLTSSTHFALLLVWLYTVSFSVFVILSIPETYSVSNLWILLYLYLLALYRGSLSRGRVLLLGMLAGVGGLYNPPLLSLSIVHVFLMLHEPTRPRRTLLAIASVGLACAVFVAANLLIMGNRFAPYMRGLSNRYASPSNYLEVDSVGTVVTNFYVFSILSPVDQLPVALSWRNLEGIPQSLARVVLFLLWVASLLWGTAKAIAKHRNGDAWPAGILLWVFVMTAFYIYFNPMQSLLYASQLVLPLLIIVHEAVHDSSMRAEVKYAAFFLAACLLAANNAQNFFGGIANP